MPKEKSASPLAKLRERLGLTQAQLAEQFATHSPDSELSERTLRNWEAGQSVKSDNLLAYAAILEQLDNRPPGGIPWSNWVFEAFRKPVNSKLWEAFENRQDEILRRLFLRQTLNQVCKEYSARDILLAVIHLRAEGSEKVFAAAVSLVKEIQDEQHSEWLRSQEQDLDQPDDPVEMEIKFENHQGVASGA